MARARKSISIRAAVIPSEYKFEEQMAIYRKWRQLSGHRLRHGRHCHYTVFGLLKSGDHIVSDWTTYSTTHEFLDHRFTDFGVETTFVDSSDAQMVESAFRPNTKVLYFETIANPTMKISDIEAIVKMAHDRGVIVICDNTFASPYVFRPLDWGADICLESATKFIGGHNDALGGTITLKNGLLPADTLEKIRWSTLTKLGGSLSPFNAWLLLRGIQTLHVRVWRDNARMP